MQPRAITPGRSSQRWLRITIVAIGAVTFVCFLALSPILRSLTKRDHDSASQRTTVAVVEQVVPPHIEENTRPLPAEVWVRVNGTLAAAATVYGSAQLHVGSRARVVYRVGRSGRTYVDSVEPAPGG